MSSRERGSRSRPTRPAQSRLWNVEPKATQRRPLFAPMPAPAEEAPNPQPTQRSDRPLLLTVEEAAEHLTVSVRTIKYLISDGKLPFVKIGRVTRVDARDIDDYIDRSRRRHRQPLRDIN